MPFELTILGVSSATPTLERHPSAQVLALGQRSFLIDCGEGTQMQILKYNLRPSKIEKILISHLHPDHYLGLLGLLTTLNLNQRTQEMHIYSQPGLKEMLEVQFRYSNIF